MSADRGRESSAGAAAEAGATGWGRVLMIGGGPEQDALRLALSSAMPGPIRVAQAAGVEEAAAQLSARRFAAVVVDAGVARAAGPQGLSRLRELAAGAALVVADGDAAREVPGAAAPAGWLSSGDRGALLAQLVLRCAEADGLREGVRAGEGALAESEARFRGIVDRTDDGIVIVDEEGRVRFVNPAAERLFGRRAEELLGEELGTAAVAGETTEMDILRPGGREPVVAELRASTTTWQGAAAEVISLRDITDRKEAQEREHRLLLAQAAREQAEEAGRRFRFLAEAGVALDASLDPDATLEQVANLLVPRVADWCVIELVEESGARRVTAVHSDPAKAPLLEELKERFPSFAGPPDVSADVLRTGVSELRREIDREGVRELATNEEHAELLTRLGIRSLIMVPLETREQRLGTLTLVCDERDFEEDDVALAREIASRAARALENARLYEAALAASRAKSDFLAVMSHELRTPLNAILGYTDLLLSGVVGEIDPTHDGYLRRVDASAQHLLEIIEEILTFAQTAEGHAEVRVTSVRIGELVEEVVAVAEQLVRERGLQLRVDVEDLRDTLQTDAGKLRQIMLNLITNAVKFTPSGFVRLGVWTRGKWLEIAVSDTGIGMTEAEMEHIFEPFRQMDEGMTRRTGGTGLGLSISRDLARLLGGELSVESTPGEGSTFTLRVPRTD